MSSHKNELILSAIATIADNIELSYEFGLFADNAKRYIIAHKFIIAG